MINRQALADELNQLLATETRSLARHLEESPPYVTPATYRIWQSLRSLAAQSRAHAQRLSELLSTLELSERPLPFSSDVARFHYTALEVLLPELIREKNRQINAYQRALEHAHSDALVESGLSSLLEENCQQLRQLTEALSSIVTGSSHSQPALSNTVS